jgi:hypothetical protein
MSSHLETQLLAIEQALEEHRREGGLSEGSYHASLVLLVAARLGPNATAIAAALDFEELFVRRIETRMRESRLWDDAEVSTEGWFYDASFCGSYADLEVAEGLSICVHTPDGVWYVDTREITSSVM